VIVDRGLLDELVAVEETGWRALCAGRGDEFYGRLMTDDGLMVLAGGQIMSRDEVVSSLRNAPPWSSYTLTNARILPCGDDAVGLVYVAHAFRDATDPPFVSAMASIYTQMDGEWRLALYQQTPVAPDRSPT
jgi:hypothetical protein